MHCAILLEPRCIELREVPVPQPQPGAIVVRVRAALTDGTDLKAYRRGHPRMPMPTRFGHEFSGDVAAVGSSVMEFSIGDAIMTAHSAPCGACYWCVRGQEELCETIMETMLLGAYAEYVEIPRRILSRNAFRKPPELPYAAAAFLEPLSCVVHSVDLLELQTESTVLVIGDGGFGILHALVLARAGAVVLIAGHRAERLALAQQLGIPHVRNTKEFDLQTAIRTLTGGRGADAVVECTGMQSVWEQAPQFVRRGGVVSFFGGLPGEARVTFHADRLHYDEVRLISPFHFGTDAVRRARDLLVSGQIEPLPLVTDRAPLSQIASVFERLDAGEGIKFAVLP